MTRLALLSAVILVSSSASVWAQTGTTTGEIRGRVVDPLGLGMPGIEVRIVNPETGLERLVLTDDAGRYVVLRLPPARYELEISPDVFAQETRSDVAVILGDVTVVDVELRLVTATTLDVVGDAVPFGIERTHQSTTIREGLIRNLPINRRNYLTYALLAPGVVDSTALADGTDFRVPQTRHSGLSFFGNNGRGNSVLADGADSNDFGGGVRLTLGQDAVQEFQINRANYSAELGGASGAVINVISKSGTNALHGSAFGYFRHHRLDAADPFAIGLVQGKPARVDPPSDRQQFGGSLGGPIRADRTFFFASFEGLERAESNSVPVVTDLSIFGPTPAQEQILATRPPAEEAALRQALSSSPATVGLFERNSGVFPFETSMYKLSLRIDHRVGTDDFALRLNHSDLDETNPNTRALVGVSRGYNEAILESDALLTWTHVAGPNAVNQARFLFNYRNFFVSSNDEFGPELNINGFGFFNRDGALPSNSITRTWELSDNLNILRGNHNLKMGGTTLIRGNDHDAFVFMGGRFFFGPLPGGLIHPALASTTINALQAFNLGLPQAYQQSFGSPTVESLIPFFAGYVHDSWSVTRSLSFDIGLRYELDDRTDPVPTDTNNFAPRVGFAWDAWSDGGTILRGGYGIFYSPDFYQLDFVSNALNEIDGRRQIAQVFTSIQTPGAPNAANVYQTLLGQGVITLPDPTRPITEQDLQQFGISVVHDGPAPPFTALFRNSEDFVNAYSHQTTLGIERHLASSTSVAASYIFSRTLKIMRARDDNLLPAPIDPVLGIPVWTTPYFRNPLLFQDNVYESTGRAFYHGLTIELASRLASSLSLDVNYTLSKAIDEVVDYNSDFQANNQLDLRAERGLSSFDQRHKLVTYLVWDSPLAGGQGGWRSVLADLRVSGILRANSSRPFNLLVGSDLNGDRHSTTDRPGLAGRNTGRGPTFWTVDMRVGRRVPLREDAELEFTFEAFNILNRLNFQGVNNTVGNIAGPFDLKGSEDLGPSEPLGFTSAFEARQIQLGVRLGF